MASRDVRVRIRPSVVRVRISETAIRTVVRGTAKQPQLHYQFAHHWRKWIFESFAVFGVRGIDPRTPQFATGYLEIWLLLIIHFYYL